MKIRVSVAMATYNGEKYIKQQIDSILKNLDNNDELIISDDGSTDNTLKIIKQYKKNDDRIKLFNGPGLGVKQNFANAIDKCSGEYIFLSDQDDYWIDNKVEKVLDVFKKNNPLLVQHDCSIVNVNDSKIIEQSYFKFRKCGPGVIKNMYKTTYIGCCMAFNKKIKDKILPIPDDIDMHDQWIGLISDHFQKSYFLKEKLIEYRRHEGNVSDCFHHYSIPKMIKNRFILLYRYIQRIWGCKK